MRHVVDIGTVRAEIIGRHLRRLHDARKAFEHEQELLTVVVQSVLAGLELPGQIVHVDEVAGTVTTEAK